MSLDWMESAACASVDSDLWFPEQGGPVTKALLICRSCPVRTECLEYAITEHMDHGIWGGLAPDARRQMRRAS